MKKERITTDSDLAYIIFENSAVIWNRFYPSILEFKKNEFIKLLNMLKNKDLIKKIDKKSISKLGRNNITFRKNFYQKKFLNEIEKNLEERYKNFKLHISKRMPFYNIQIFNEECNLKCSYCIMKYTWGNYKRKNRKKIKNKKRMLSNIIQILDQQYEAIRNYPEISYSLVFNGGEILLHFDILKKIVKYIRIQKSDIKTKISLNTNGTLITKEVGQFFKKYKIEAFISIDSNKDQHNKTRVYHNGNGSFGDVLKSLKLLKENKYKLDYTQGTIQHFDLINEEEFLNINKNYGFKSAMLYPNVMGIKPSYGVNRAVRFYKFFKNISNSQIKLSDSCLKRFVEITKNGLNSHGKPYCNGLGATLDKFLVMYNMSDNSLSYSCQFIPQLSLTMENIKNSIFSEMLLDVSYDYQKQRLKTLEILCKDCPIIGICKGGCILNGLDSFNNKNEASCNFWKTLWYLYIKDLIKYN